MPEKKADFKDKFSQIKDISDFYRLIELSGGYTLDEIANVHDPESFARDFICSIKVAAGMGLDRIGIDFTRLTTGNDAFFTAMGHFFRFLKDYQDLNTLIVFNSKEETFATEKLKRMIQAIDFGKNPFITRKEDLRKTPREKGIQIHVS